MSKVPPAIVIPDEEQQQQQESAPPLLSPMLMEEQDNNNTATNVAHYVEPDMDVEMNDNDEVIQLSHSRKHNIPTQFLTKSSSQHSVSNSSLSGDDDDASEDEGLIPAMRQQQQTSPMSIPEEQQQQPLQQQQPKKLGAVVGFGRSDSAASSSSMGSWRASSQNSSNDWGYGWYEDVYTPEHLSSTKGGNVAAKRSKNDSAQRSDNNEDSRKKSAGMVPQVSSGDVNQVQYLKRIDDNPDAAAMAVTAPPYVLEESLSSQKLWKHTAGQRPPQPFEERAFYEKMWAQNFARSQVKYALPVEVLTATTPISFSPFSEVNCDVEPSADDNVYAQAPPASSHADATSVTEDHLMQIIHDRSHHNANIENATLPKTIGDLTVLGRGVNAFGTTVSKSFARFNERGGPIDTVNISIASYRVVESKKHGKFAQFLVIYREGSIRDTVGVWKRYRDFEELANKITQAHEGCTAVIANVSPLAVTEEPDMEHLPNAITSWRLLKKRQRWYRCLDAGYLSLKVFLLERFLHDILFESSSPKLLRDFVGAGSALA